MRALFVTLPEKGHFHPLIGPARALAAQGHEVCFTAPADCREELLRAGAPRVLLPPFAPRPSDELRGKALAELLRDPERLRAWIRLLLVRSVEPDIEPLRQVVRELQPDVVAIDSMAYAGAIAAHLEGVPWVGLATSLNPVVPPDFDSELIRTTSDLNTEREILFAKYGISHTKFRISDVLSPWGTACFTTADFARWCPDGVERVGPSRRPHVARFDTEFAQGRPVVYASFGSQAWHQPRRFEVLIAACARLGFALHLAMGDLAKNEWPASRVRCVPVADQLGVLQQASAIVTHGGANSVMESLDAGVPMLLSPLCNDQPHNLAFVERAGAGLGLDLDTADDRTVADALEALVGDGPIRAAAYRISASYQAADGNAGAAAMIARAAR